jgi:hypothetical protein
MTRNRDMGNESAMFVRTFFIAAAAERAVPWINLMRQYGFGNSSALKKVFLRRRMFLFTNCGNAPWFDRLPRRNNPLPSNCPKKAVTVMIQAPPISGVYLLPSKYKNIFYPFRFVVYSPFLAAAVNAIIEYCFHG